MAYFGKTFKKTELENATELFDAVNANDEVRAFFEKSDISIKWDKNDDGSLQCAMKLFGHQLFDTKVELDTDIEGKAPDGTATTQRFTMEGDEIVSDTDFNGKHLVFTFQFEDDSMKMIVKSDDLDTPAIINFVAEE